MTLRVDDMRIGQWLVITYQHSIPEKIRPNIRYDGRPWRIEAISLPFIAVSCGTCIHSIDVRDFIFGRCTSRYAHMMMGAEEEPVEAKPKKERMRCVNCGEKMVLIRIKGQPEANRWYCCKCDRTHEVSAP